MHSELKLWIHRLIRFSLAAGSLFGFAQAGLCLRAAAQSRDLPFLLLPGFCAFASLFIFIPLLRHVQTLCLRQSQEFDRLQEHCANLERTKAQMQLSSARLHENEALLKANEARFRAMNAASPVGIFVANPIGDCLYVNTQWEQITGMTEAQALGRGWMDSIHPDDRERIIQAWDAFTRENIPFHQTLRYLHEDESVTWGNARATDMWNDETLLGYVGVVENITERKVAEEALRESRRFIERITDTSPDILYIYDLVEQSNVYTNRQIGETLGYTPEQVQAMGSALLSTLIHPDDLSYITSQHQRFAWLKDGETLESEYRMRCADGTWRWLYSRDVIFARAEDGSATQMLGTARDITDQKQAEQTQMRLTSILEATSDFVITADLSGSILYSNSAARRVLYGSEEVMTDGKSLTDSHPEWALEIILEQGVPAAMKAGLWGGETAIQDYDGREIPVSQVIIAHKDSAGEVDYLSTVMRDISERKKIEQQMEIQVMLAHEINTELEFQKREMEEANARLADANARLTALSVTDGLTGLKNHRAFQEYLEQEVQRSVRYQMPLSVLLVDVDHFKQYNDTFGHPAGDEVLKRVAHLLQVTARVSDFVARYGGEEFVIILTSTGRYEAHLAANRFREAIATAAWTERNVTVSIGMATLSAATQDRAQLIAEADQALYTSKQRGRNCVTHFLELGEVEAIGEK